MTELSKSEIHRYSRHLILPEITMEGQKKLKNASVLLIGTGGLGAPVSMYLAAAGVGRMGLVDFDVVDESNLQRQILFSTSDVGRPKTEAAQERLAGLNPNVKLEIHEQRIEAANAMKLIEPYDIVIDGTDNFPTRYCVNDVCVMLKKPNIYGSIFRFEGQATVFDPRSQKDVLGDKAEDPEQPMGPCYRCLYPEPPPPGMMPSCAEGGVLGILPGLIGCIQATEAIKLLLGIGQTLCGRLLRYSALEMTFETFNLNRDLSCPVCGDSPSITEPIDYVAFCGIRGEESDSIVRQAPIPEITVEALKAKIEQGDFEGDKSGLIDVREPAEHQICALAQAQLIPLKTLAGRLNELNKNTQYIVHCKLGGRSAQAVDLLRENGFDAINLVGGITAWAKNIDPSMPIY